MTPGHTKSIHKWSTSCFYGELQPLQEGIFPFMHDFLNLVCNLEESKERFGVFVFKYMDAELCTQPCRGSLCACYCVDATALSLLGTPLTLTSEPACWSKSRLALLNAV